MEENNDNNIDENHDQQQYQVDHQRQAAADNDEDEENEAVAATVLKLNTILERRKEFPLRQRNRIVELTEEYLGKLEDDIHEMICDQDANDYHGLDSNRDTVAEVETALRTFPNILSRRKEVKWDYNFEQWIRADNGEGDYPIQCLLSMGGTKLYRKNVKAVPFVAVLARLGNELNQFEEEERGGLLCKDRFASTALVHLVQSSHSRYGDEHNQLVDTVCMMQLVQLKQIYLFKKEDICSRDLVSFLCDEGYFAERRFQFLVGWDPTSLLHYDEEDGLLPLHYVATNSVQGFQLVFDFGIRFYPIKKGIMLLFQKDNNGNTPFQRVREWFEQNKVMKVVEEILIRYYSEETPLNIAGALITAAIDTNIHFDCLYFLLRRRPDVLVDLLSGSTNDNNGNDDNDSYDDGNDDGGGGGDNNVREGQRQKGIIKRKRKRK